jgi:hypothetical protein
MLNPERISILNQKILEVLRIEGNNTSPAYIDISNNLGSISSRTPHVVFGRRGTGKSTLISEAIKKAKQNQNFCIKVDCEDFKNHHFPDVIVAMVGTIFDEIQSNISFLDKLLHPIIAWKLSNSRKRIRKLLEKPLSRNNEDSQSTGKSLEVSKGPVKGGLIWGETLKQNYQTEKLDEILKEIPVWKDILHVALVKKREESYAFVFFDDFYHLKAENQADIADVIHRLCKGKNLFFKIATIKHRTILYGERFGQPIGVQARHDYQTIDLDFSLEKFDETKEDLFSILKGIANTCGVQPTELEELFAGGGLNRLVFASGGVPRDFLSLFASYLTSNYPSSQKKLGKDAVREFALKAYAVKKDELKIDADSQDLNDLEGLFNKIYAFCVDGKMKNVFQIDREQERSKPKEYSYILKLADLRLIHLVALARSNPTHAGKVFDIYCLDVGSYAHLRKLEGKLDEIDLSEGKNAIDRLRSAPIFAL